MFLVTQEMKTDWIRQGRLNGAKALIIYLDEDDIINCADVPSGMRTNEYHSALEEDGNIIIEEIFL